MKTIKLITIGILSFAILAITSCSKTAGFNGNSTISGLVTDSVGTVSGAIVSLAFGATSVTSNYNYSTVTDSTGHYYFYDLQQGNYYVGATYTDYLDQGQSIVLRTGGDVVKLGGNKSSATVNLFLN